MHKFQVVRNAVSLEMVGFLKNGMLMIREAVHNNKRIPLDRKDPFYDWCGASFSRYGSVMFDTMMVKMKPVVEEIVGKRLVPTYSYWRIYWNGSFLPKHKDRAACEYSVTLAIDSDGDPWPIYVEGEPIYLDAGDMVVYLGPECEHWRETYMGNRHMQMFMHYVDADGPNASMAYDGRQSLGMPNPHVRDASELRDKCINL